MTDTTTVPAAAPAAKVHSATSEPEFQSGPFVVDLRLFHADGKTSAAPALGDAKALPSPSSAPAPALMTTPGPTAVAPATDAAVAAPRVVSFETTWRLTERDDAGHGMDLETCIEPDALWCRLSACARVPCSPAHTSDVGKWFVSDAEMVAGAGQPAMPGGQMLLVRFRVADPVAALRDALDDALPVAVLQYGVLAYIPELVTQWLPRTPASGLDKRAAAFDADAAYRTPLRRVHRRDANAGRYETVCTPVLESLVPGLLAPAPDGRPYTLHDAITAFVCAEFERYVTLWRVDPDTGTVVRDAPVACEVAPTAHRSLTDADSASCGNRDAMTVRGVDHSNSRLLLGRVSALRLADGTDVCLHMPAWDPATQPPPQLRVGPNLIAVLKPRANGTGISLTFAGCVTWCITHRCVRWL